MKLPRARSLLSLVGAGMALALLTHPELRAIFLVADALGLEVLLLLAAAQLRTIWPVVRAGLAEAVDSSRPTARLLRRCITGIVSGAMAFRSVEAAANAVDHTLASLRLRLMRL